MELLGLLIGKEFLVLAGARRGQKTTQRGAEGNPDKLWNAGYAFLLGTQVLTAFSFYMIVTVLISFLTGGPLGVTTALAGFISGLFSITSFVCRPFCGVLSDRLNKVWLLRVATIMTLVGCIGYPLATSVPAIIVVRIIHGVGFAVNSTALVSLATSYIPHKRLGEGIGYLGIANVIGSAAAPGLGIMLSERLGTESVFIVASIMSALAVVTFFFFSARKDGGERVHRALHIDDIIATKVLSYAAMSGIFSFTNGVISAYLLMYSQAIGLAGIGLYFTLNAIVMFVVRPLAGRINDACGLSVVAFPGFIMTVVSMVLLAFAYRLGDLAFPLIMLSGVIRAIGQGSVNPALQTESIKEVGQGRSGVATSTFYLGGDIGQGVGPMVAGAIIGAQTTDVQRYSAVFLLCGALLVVAMGLLVLKLKRNRRIPCDSPLA